MAEKVNEKKNRSFRENVFKTFKKDSEEAKTFKKDSEEGILSGLFTGFCCQAD